MTRKEKRQIMSHLAEFFLIGLVMGIFEDLLAIKLATDAEITLQTFFVAGAVALPFAVISELLVDIKFFRKKIFKRG